jgi:site-specific DNA recombinase
MPSANLGRPSSPRRRAEGWIPVVDDYDDGGFSGGNMDRPALKRLLADIDTGKVDIVVVYKIDRLTRSLADLPRWWNCSTIAG